MNIFSSSLISGKNLQSHTVEWNQKPQDQLLPIKYWIDLLGDWNTSYICRLCYHWENLKGCLCCKTITFQNVSYEAQIRNFFYFVENLCSILKIFKLFYFLASYNVINMWHHDWVLVHETLCNFEYIFWTTTHKVAKLDQLIDINEGNNFKNLLNNLEDWG